MRPFCPVVAVATIFAGGGMSSDGRGVGSWNFPTADVRPVIATSGDRARHVRGVAFRTRDERRAEEALNLELRFPPMTAGPGRDLFNHTPQISGRSRRRVSHADHRVRERRSSHGVVEGPEVRQNADVDSPARKFAQAVVDYANR